VDSSVKAALFRGYRDAFRIVFIVGAALAAGAGIVACFLMPQIDLDSKEKEQNAARDSETSQGGERSERNEEAGNQAEKIG
jgi:phosphotransferase system  glucose/maltose/N-acetylglucosamine-specific IIC component